MRKGEKSEENAMETERIAGPERTEANAENAENPVRTDPARTGQDAITAITVRSEEARGGGAEITATTDHYDTLNTSILHPLVYIIHHEVENVKWIISLMAQDQCYAFLCLPNRLLLSLWNL